MYIKVNSVKEINFFHLDIFTIICLRKAPYCGDKRMTQAQESLLLLASKVVVSPCAGQLQKYSFSAKQHEHWCLAHNKWKQSHAPRLSL